jgi:dihydrofolate synthase/folylpolyglutamate synthase
VVYSEVLEYLLEQLPMFQRVGAAAYRSNLDNITQLCNLLNNPHRGLKCIHVAGTNGKGSVVHFIASILQEQGYKVGVFASPHYKDYRERIKINGEFISRRWVTAFINKYLVDFRNINASFFEVTTAMAFQYFKDKKVDFAVIETGMGGRLDSTNVVQPLLSVITNISFDHTQFLGNTIPQIASEKAGIIKPDTPVVIGETHKESKPVFIEKAKSCNSKIVFADKQQLQFSPPANQGGIYQRKNIRTAVSAVIELKKVGVKVNDVSVRKGLANVVGNTNFIGRWMILQKTPLVIADSAHNEAGIKELLRGIRGIKFNNLHFVYGTVSDKDVTAILNLLPKKGQYYFCKANIPRGLNTDLLSEQAMKFGLKGNTYSSVQNALKAAKKAAAFNDLIIVSGSVFVVAEAL